MIKADPSHRYVALDSLRGVCASMVVLHHVPGPLEAVPLVKNAYLFVDFFFVLSGFVIGSSYGTRLAQGYAVTPYMLQRFFRVWPLHMVMLLAFFAFEMVFAAGWLGGASRQPFVGNYSPSSLVASILLIQPFVGPDAAPWNGPAWSIAVEFWTYLIFALAVKAAPRALVPACLVVMVVAPVLLALGSDRNMYVFHDGALARCLFGFTAGVVLWQLPRTWRDRPLSRRAGTVIEVAAAGLCLAFVWYAGAGRLTLVAPLVFGLVVLVFSYQRGALSQTLLTRPMVALGTLSYSIYMVHLFIIWRYFNGLSVLQRVSGSTLVTQRDGAVRFTDDIVLSTALTVPILVAVIITAMITHRLIEKPGVRLGRRLANARGSGTRIAGSAGRSSQS